MDEPTQHRAWVHPLKARYYQARLDRALFGTWTLRKAWGGLGSRRGGSHSTSVASYADGLEQIREITKRRTQHGYKSIPED